PKPDMKPAGVKVLLEDVCSLCSQMIRNSNIRITCTVIPDNLQILVDRKMTEQVLINLIRNSLEALTDKPKGILTIKAKHLKHDAVQVSIEDNGSGIPEEIMEQVFVPFFTTKEKGSGIGLSLSRRIMQLHKGFIRLNSKPGKGTTVILTFPADQNTPDFTKLAEE
ncbi:MAG: HAMP domain-containing histidine kinase, partial [Bacteroidales bacterium]